jgi:hypothetical protein
MLHTEEDYPYRSLDNGSSQPNSAIQITAAINNDHVISTQMASARDRKNSINIAVQMHALAIYIFCF